MNVTVVQNSVPYSTLTLTFVIKEGPSSCNASQLPHFLVYTAILGVFLCKLNSYVLITY